MNSTPTSEFSALRIWQANLNRSNIAQQAFLHTFSPHDADLLLIQEPYMNPRTTLTTATYGWRVVYPTRHHDHHAKGHVSRSIILVSTRIRTDAWEQIPVCSPDLTVIRLRTSLGPVYIINIYNEQAGDDTLHILRELMRTLPRDARPFLKPGQRFYVLWAGDFNRHHPSWELDSNPHLLTSRYLNAAAALTELLVDFGMQQLLPAGIPTLQALASGNYTRPDNVFGDVELADLMTACKVEPHFRPPNTDY